MLREEVEQYTKLTGEDGWHVPLMKVGAYLDGYNKGLEVLDKIRAEIEAQRKKVGKKCSEDDALTNYCFGLNDGLKDARDIIDKYKAESEDKE